MKNIFKMFGTQIRRICAIALVAVIGFSMAACDNGNGDDENNGNSGGSNSGGSNGDVGKWRQSKSKSYTITDGIAILSGESVYNYTTYNYTSDTNFEQRYTVNTTYYHSDGTTATGTGTYHITRNGQTHVYTYETYNLTYTYTSTFDSASGLQLTNNSTQTTTNGENTTTNTSEISYNIELISDSGGVKTYKSSCKTITSNGVSIDISSNPVYQGYTIYKKQNGRTIEVQRYTADGEREGYDAICNDPIIIAKVGAIGVGGSDTSGSATFEVLSDSATELVIRVSSFRNNVLIGYSDDTYEKVN